MKAIKLKELFSNEPLDYFMAHNLMKFGLYPENFKGKGVTISVPVGARWQSEAKEKNKVAYDSIMAHQDLYNFFSSPCYRDLEEFRDSEYTHKYIWLKLFDRMACGLSRLIITSFPAPDCVAKEPYYNANTLDEFWDVARKLTDMYNYPNDVHEPIILKQDNGMCGSAHKQWEINVH